MSDAKKKTPAKDDKAKVNRGTNNDMEVVALIVSENLSLRKRVLDRIKQVREAKDRRDAQEKKPPA